MRATQRQLNFPFIQSDDLSGMTASSEAVKNGNINKLFEADRAVHDWYRFVLSFPPQLVRHYLDKFKVTKNQIVLDPFCGTGTTLVEAKLLGYPSIGIEANPFAHYATQVKINWGIDPDELYESGKKIAHQAKCLLEKDEIFENCSVIDHKDSLLRTLSPEISRLLLTNSISPIPLHKSLVLQEIIDQYQDFPFYDHLRLAFANTLVFTASNLHFGPEVGVGKTKKDAPVVSCWLNKVKQISDDIRLNSANSDILSIAFHGDSRDTKEIINSYPIDAVITSPPYPNEKDYSRTTRLELVMLGFIRSKDDLRQMKRGLIRSNTRGVYVDDMDDQWVANHPEIQRVANEIESRRIELGKDSGFERMYSRVTQLYFGGMVRHLNDLKSVLKPGANLAYVVGDQASYLRVMIRTGQILADLAGEIGYQVKGIDLFRTRYASATKEQLREEVVLLQWPG